MRNLSFSHQYPATLKCLKSHRLMTKAPSTVPKKEAMGTKYGTIFQVKTTPKVLLWKSESFFSGQRIGLFNQTF